MTSAAVMTLHDSDVNRAARAACREIAAASSELAAKQVPPLRLDARRFLEDLVEWVGDRLDVLQRDPRGRRWCIDNDRLLELADNHLVGVRRQQIVDQELASVRMLRALDHR